MARPNEHSRLQRLGLLVVLVSAASFGGLVLLTHGRSVLEARTTVRSDFRTITGLRHGSPVQLGGVLVGEVSSVDFVKVQYACDSISEDIGRYGEGRTNNCDDSMFCSPVGLCADLEPMTSLRDHTLCIESDDCREDEVCITSEFNQRARHVVWPGPEGVCVRYNTHHVRVRVEMGVPTELVTLVRRDSHASVASNSILGDYLVNISPGIGEPLGLAFRVQARSSLYEDIERWRDRLDRVMENVEISMAAVTEVFVELRDPRWLGAIRGTAVNLEAITAMLVRGDGLIGALINEPDYKRDFALMVRGIRDTMAGLSGTVHNLNSLLNAVSANIDPVFAQTRAASGALRTLLADLRDVENHSLGGALLDGRSAQIAADLEALIEHTERIAYALEGISSSVARAEGTVGMLIDDPKVAGDVGRLLDRLSDHEFTAALFRWALQITGTMDIDASRDPAGSPIKRR